MSSFVLDWREFHEKADNTELPEALKKVGSKPDYIENLYILGLVYLNLHKDKQAQSVFK